MSFTSREGFGSKNNDFRTQKKYSPQAQAWSELRYSIDPMKHLATDGSQTASDEQQRLNAIQREFDHIARDLDKVRQELDAGRPIDTHPWRRLQTAVGELQSKVDRLTRATQSIANCSSQLSTRVDQLCAVAQRAMESR